VPIAKALKTNGVIVDSCRTLGKMTKPSALRVLKSSALAVELDFPIKTSAEIEKRFREIIREFGSDCTGMREKA
jgi:hypothetical protein